MVDRKCQELQLRFRAADVRRCSVSRVSAPGGVSLARVDAPHIARAAEILERARISTKGELEILSSRWASLHRSVHDQELRDVGRLLAGYDSRVRLL